MSRGGPGVFCIGVGIETTPKRVVVFTFFLPSSRGRTLPSPHDIYIERDIIIRIEKQYCTYVIYARFRAESMKSCRKMCDFLYVIFLAEYVEFCPKAYPTGSRKEISVK